MITFLISILVLVLLAVGVFKVAILPMLFRVVVSTNEIHVVQRVHDTTSYGKGESAGNVYYKWPAWVPRIGCRVTVLPVSVFRLDLEDYPAYDQGRVPFIVDIVSFFRVAEPVVASERVSDQKELRTQLEGILKGALRSILATSQIESILEARAEFGGRFTNEVDEQLKEWGVKSVKCIELMDIRDDRDSKAIANIMAKNKSKIEMESRVTVAANIQTAKVAEVEAQQKIDIRQREAEELVGKRAAERDQNIGIATQKARQQVAEEEKNTALKTMAVNEVNTVRAAEITRAQTLVQADQAKQIAGVNRDQQVIVADQAKQVAVIAAQAEQQRITIGAEAEKARLTLVAEGQLENATLHAKGVELQGAAEGAAEQAKLMAPVNSQIALAKEIGQNAGYQTYLVTVRQIEAGQAVGVEQAKALERADVKIIANTGAGGPVEGIHSVADLFSPAGGLKIGAALEAFKNTGVGKEIIDRVVGKNSGSEAR